MITVDIYGRVSTQEQAREGYSIGEQEERLKKYCESQGWLIHRVLMDGGYSGASLDRPAIQTALSDARERKIDKLVVYKLDRLSRSQKDTLYIIEDVLLKNHVDFVSMTESLDTSTPFGMAMIGILSVFAQLERETIHERMSIGMDARIKSGKYRGCGHIPIGFTYSDGELHLNDYEAMIIRQMFEDYASGETANAIAVKLYEKKFRMKSWSAEKVKRVLSNPIYKGQQRYKGEVYIVENAPKIVSGELFDLVQSEISRRTNQRSDTPQSPHKHTTLLGGLLWCGCCGQRMTAESDTDASGKRIYRYYCYGRILKRHKLGGTGCTARSWRSTELNRIVLDEMKKISLVRDSAPVIKETSKSDTEALRSELSKLDSQLDKLIGLYTLGGIDADALKRQAEKLQSQKFSIHEQLENALTKNGLSADDVTKEFTSFEEIIDNCGEESMELYQIVHRLIQAVIVGNDSVEIRWNF